MYLGLQILLVLSISKFSKWISCHSAIASENVKVAVVSEQKLSTVVVGRWFVNFQNNPGLTVEMTKQEQVPLNSVYPFFLQMRSSNNLAPSTTWA